MNKALRILTDPKFVERFKTFVEHSSPKEESPAQLMKRIGIVLTAPYPDPAEKSEDFGGETHNV